MKKLKVMVLILMTVIFATAPLHSVAGNKAQKKQQAQQKKADKKKIKDNKKHYKQVQKPVLKQQKAANKKAQKQAKSDIKNNKKNLKKAAVEENKFYKARMASKNALLKQGKKMEVAQRKAELNPTDKNIKAKNDLETRYNKALKDYQEGPKKRWQDKAAAKSNATKALDNSNKNYTKAKTDGVRIALDKIKAKAAINNTKSVSNGLYNAQPTFVNVAANGLAPGESRGLKSAQSKKKEPIYDSVPPLLPIYDRVNPQQMANYAKPNDALQF